MAFLSRMNCGGFCRKENYSGILYSCRHQVQSATQDIRCQLVRAGQGCCAVLGLLLMPLSSIKAVGVRGVHMVSWQRVKGSCLKLSSPIIHLLWVFGEHFCVQCSSALLGCLVGMMCKGTRALSAALVAMFETGRGPFHVVLAFWCFFFLHHECFSNTQSLCFNAQISKYSESGG